MKVSCTHENINTGLNIVNKIVSKNTSLPILSNILLQTENKNLNLTATNLEIAIKYVVRCRVEEDGEIAVPAEILSNYINILPKDRVDFFSTDNDLHIECGAYKTKIIGNSVLDFPPIPSINTDICYQVGVDDLKELISQTVFAVSTSYIKPEIGGVLFNFLEDRLVVAATDGYRIAEKTIKLKNKNSPVKTIIQARVLQELLRIFSLLQKDNITIKQETNLEIYISNTQAVFKYNSFELVSKAVSGTYPNYEPIIPKTFTTKAVINTEDFIRGVKASSLFSKTNTFDIVIDVDQQQSLVSLKGSSANIGENIVEYKNVKIEGESNKIVLNYKYLLSGLLNITSEDFIIEITTPTNPCLVKPVTEELGSQYLYIIMPLRQ